MSAIRKEFKYKNLEFAQQALNKLKTEIDTIMDEAISANFLSAVQIRSIENKQNAVREIAAEWYDLLIAAKTSAHTRRLSLQSIDKTTSSPFYNLIPSADVRIRLEFSNRRKMKIMS